MEHLEAGQEGHKDGLSLYGYDMLEFVAEYAKHLHSAHEAATYVLTHGYRYPKEQAVDALRFFDRHALEVLEKHPEMPVARERAFNGGDAALEMYVNSLGRLHIRKAGEERPAYDRGDHFVDLGYVCIPAAAMQEICARTAEAYEQERAQLQRVKRALDRVHANGTLPAVLEQVIDHVEHVESVCFYVEDRFFAVIDRFANLIDTKGVKGCLPRLREKDYRHWTDEEILSSSVSYVCVGSKRTPQLGHFPGAPNLIVDPIVDLGRNPT